MIYRLALAKAFSRSWRALAMLLAAASIALLAGSAHSVAASDRVPPSASADGKRRIDFAGRQQMLSQLMGKAACFIRLDAQAERHRNALATAHWLFTKTLNSLREGSDIDALLPEESRPVLDRLSAVESVWSSLSPAVLEAARPGGGSTAALDSVIEKNLELLSSMNRTVREMERAYSTSGKVEEGIAVAINLAGRQRMLTQRAAKEFCLIALGRSAEETRESLAGTVSLFETTLDDLKQGNADLGIPPPPIGDIGDQLDRIDGMWQPLSEIFGRVAAGAKPSKEDFEVVLANNERVLEEMNKAVLLYEIIK